MAHGKGEAMFHSRAILAFILFAIAAPAQAVVYDCKIKSHSIYGWVPERLILEIRSQKGKPTRGFAIDPFIKNAYDKPIQVKLEEQGTRKAIFRWSVDKIPVSDSRSTFKAAFRATLDLKTLKVRTTTWPSSFDHVPPAGSGRCKIISK